jgi:hypothetical protein
MSLLASWPTLVDDSGDSQSGTILNKQVFDDVKASIEDNIHSTGNPTVKTKTIIDEVITARGNLANLNARIGGVIDADGALVTQASLVSQTVLGQNIVVGNMLVNPFFLQWTGGDADSWTLTGAGATVTQTGIGLGDTTRKVGKYAAMVTRSGANALLTQSIIASGNFANWDHLKTQKVVFAAYVKAGIASQARLSVDDGTTTSQSSFHTGGGSFEWLTVIHTVSGAATKLEVALSVESSNGDVYVSGPIAYPGTVAIDQWKPGPREMDQETRTGVYFQEIAGGYKIGGTLTPSGALTIGGALVVSTGGADITWDSNSRWGHVQGAPAIWTNGEGEGLSDGGQVTSAANQTKYYLTYIPFRMSVVRITINISTGEASKNAGVGIYNLSGTKIWATGAISVASNGTKTATITPVTIGPGFYYLAMTDDGTTGTVRYKALSSGSVKTSISNVTTSAKLFGSAANASSAGVLPATLGALTNGTIDVPFVVFITE